MIPCNTPQQETQSGSFTQVIDLLEYLQLSANTHPVYDLTPKDFPFRVTRHFASLMEKGHWQDPLLQQVLPLIVEQQAAVGYELDPLQDCAAHTGNGVLQKYQGRALLITTGACAINCRYCFRRHFPYSEHTLSPTQLTAGMTQISKRSDITEVILSGGDPLMLSDSKLQHLINEIASISHVKRLRIHTRVPVVLPDKMIPTFFQLLKKSRLKIILVLHVNHPNEISAPLGDFVKKMLRNDCTVLNQTVLLKGINDSSKIQINLAEKLFENGILPYYLHQLDKVAGASHFAVRPDHAQKIYQEMRNFLPGYLLAKFVVEQPDALSKLPVI